MSLFDFIRDNVLPVIEESSEQLVQVENKIFGNSFRYALGELEDRYILICSIPNADKNKFDIKRRGLIITINGERVPYPFENMIYNETHVGQFTRRIELPENTGKTINTTYINGELVISFSKITEPIETINVN